MAEAERVQRQLLENQLKEEYEKRKTLANDDFQGSNHETSDNSVHGFGFENKRREELLSRLVYILSFISNQLETEPVKGVVKRENVVNIHRSYSPIKPVEKANESEDCIILENQRALLAGTLKLPMQRLVNVLHEIVEQGSPSSCEMRGSYLAAQNAVNTSNNYRPTSSYYSSSYSSSSSSYSSYSSSTSSYLSYSSYSSRTYIPTGRTEYVRGHWRRRNGKLEYVRPHTRRK